MDLAVAIDCLGKTSFRFSPALFKATLDRFGMRPMRDLNNAEPRRQESCGGSARLEKGETRWTSPEARPGLPAGGVTWVRTPEGPNSGAGRIPGEMGCCYQQLRLRLAGLISQNGTSGPRRRAHICGSGIIVHLAVADFAGAIVDATLRRQAGKGYQSRRDQRPYLRPLRPSGEAAARSIKELTDYPFPL